MHEQSGPPVLHGSSVCTYDPIPFVPIVHCQVQLNDEQGSGYGVVRVVVVDVDVVVVAPHAILTHHVESIGPVGVYCGQALAQLEK